MNRRELIAAQRERIVAIAHRHGASTIMLFGSVANGTDRSDSDVDFVVDMESGRSLLDLGAIQIELQDLLRCHVDVITRRGLNARIRSRVFQEAVLV